MEKAPITCVAQEGKCKASCRAPTGVAGGTLACRQRLFNSFTSIEHETLKKNRGTSSQSLLSFTIVFHVLLFRSLDFRGAVSKLHLVPVRCQNGGGGQCLQDGEAESNQRVRADQ